MDTYSLVAITWPSVVSILNKLKGPSDTSTMRAVLGRNYSLTNAASIVLRGLTNTSVLEFLTC